MSWGRRKVDVVVAFGSSLVASPVEVKKYKNSVRVEDELCVSFVQYTDLSYHHRSAQYRVTVR